MINAEQLAKLNISLEWLQPLNDVFNRYEINTPLRMAAFIGQCAHESGNFKLLIENLNYSAEGLCKVWPSRFPTLQSAQTYARNPDKIANKVYGGRMGNGTEETGEGSLYKGRGLIQLTGKDNYRMASDALGENFVSNPNLVCSPKYACLTAGWFWNKRGLNKEADLKDYDGMTKKINGGLNHLEERKAKIAKALAILA
jgi:putative chitinase